MSGGGGRSTQTIEKADPWAGQQPYLLDIFQQAKNQFNSSMPGYFPSSTVAPQSPDTQRAIEMMRGAVPGQQQLATQGAGATSFALMSPDVANNPYATGAIGAAINPAVRAFSDPGGVLSQIRGEFGSADQYGGTRHALALGMASDRLGQNILDTTSRMAGDFYGQGLTAQGRALALLPGIQQAQATPAATQSIVGQTEETYAQQIIDEAIKKWNFEQNLPALKLQNYQNIVGGGNYGGTTTSTGPAARTNPLLQAVGAGAAGAAIGAATGFSQGGVYGAAIGALIGLLS